MKVCIDLSGGNSNIAIPLQCDVQVLIDALQRAIDGKPLSCDFIYLTDAKYILEGLKQQLPKSGEQYRKDRLFTK